MLEELAELLSSRGLLKNGERSVNMITFTLYSRGVSVIGEQGTTNFALGSYLEGHI